MSKNGQRHFKNLAVFAVIFKVSLTFLRHYIKGLTSDKNITSGYTTYLNPGRHRILRRHVKVLRMLDFGKALKNFNLKIYINF